MRNVFLLLLVFCSKAGSLCFAYSRRQSYLLSTNICMVKRQISSKPKNEVKWRLNLRPFAPKFESKPLAAPIRDE